MQKTKKGLDNMLKTELVLDRLKIKNLKIKTVSVADQDFDIHLTKKNDTFLLEYKNINHLFRGLGLIKRNQNLEEFDIKENCSFENLGYMVDAARNAVPSIKTLKEMVVNLAILGYNQMYLYLEDVIEVQNEQYFGYLRGRYTEKEIKELDNFAKELGIELVPCVETLAHLNCIFHWPHYSSINDTADILLVGDKKTKQLIENLFKTISNCFSSKTIHIGMDEAYLVGRGRYQDINGSKQTFDVIYQHLKDVEEIAKQYGYKLQMWSDMFFRASFDGVYYKKDGTLSEKTRNKAIAHIDQFYWDYVTDNEEMLDNMFKNHKLLNKDLSFAAGAWKWNGINPSNKYSIYNLKIQIPKCKEYKVKNFLLTAWSDDGAEASVFSTLPTIINCAELSYNDNIQESELENISNNLFHFHYNDFLDSDLTLVKKGEELCGYNYLNYSSLAKILLFNDPLSGAYDGVIKEHFSLDNLKNLTIKMNNHAKNNPAFEWYFKNLSNLCSVLEIKAKLGLRLRDCYQRKDCNGLKHIIKKEIPCLIKRLDRLINSSYKQWMNENKSNGLDLNIKRLGGLKERLSIVIKLVNDYLTHRVESINELEEELIAMNEEDALTFVLWTNYKKIFTNGVS